MAAAESPPPTTVTAPLLVALTNACATALVPLAKFGISKMPMGPFTHHRPRREDELLERRDACRTNVDAGEIRRDGVDRHHLCRRIVVDLRDRDRVDRQHQPARRRGGGIQHLTCDIDPVRLKQRPADLAPLRLEEGEHHPAADEQRVDLREQVLDDVDLAGDLRSADDGEVGAGGVAHGTSEVVDLLFHEQPGHAG